MQCNSLQSHEFFIQVDYVHRKVAVHATYMRVHVRRHLRTLMTVRAFELRLLPALESHVFLHVA